MKSLPSILRRDVSTSLAIVVLFGLGIGLFVTVLGWIHGLLLPRLPFDEPEEIVAVTSRDLASGESSLEFSAADGVRWLSGTERFEATAAFSMFRAPVTDRDAGSRFWVAAEVTPSFFDIAGVAPRMGRTFDASDGGDVVIVGHRLWREQLGSEKDVLGRTVRVYDTPRTVIGVMPEGFRFPLDQQVWTPLRLDGDERGTVQLVGRLADGVTRERAGAEAAARLGSGDVGRRVALERYVAAHTDEAVRRGVVPLLVGAASLLLICWLDALALLVARNASRRREWAIRSALGATPARLGLRGLAEVAGLTLAASLLALGVADLGLHLSRRLSELNGLTGPSWVEVGLSPPVYLGLAALSLLTFLVGSWPALPSLGGRRDLRSALGSSPRTGMDRAEAWTARALVAGQVVVSVALVLLFLATGARVRALAAPEDAVPMAEIDVAKVSLLRAEGGEAVDPRSVFRHLRSELEHHPAIETVAFASYSPLRGAFPGRIATGAAAATPAGSGPRDDAWLVVSDEYFDAVDVELLAGRGLSAADPDGDPVAVVSRSFALSRFPAAGDDGNGGVHRALDRTLGRTLRIGDDPPRTIVGVVSDVPFVPNDPSADRSLVYVPMSQRPRPAMVTVLRRRAPRSAFGAADFSAALSRALPFAGGFGFRSLENELAETRGARLTLASLFGLFGLLALLVSSLGTLGVARMVSGRRRRSWAVRLAVGASRRRILGEVLVGGLAAVAAGGIVGLLLGGAILQRLGEAFHGASAVGFGVAAFGLQAVVALLALLQPALSASRVDPASLLREE